MDNLKKKIEQARAEAIATLKTCERKDRRKVLMAAKFLEKAALQLGLERTHRERPKSVGEIKYPDTGEKKPIPEPVEPSDVLADNLDDKPKRTRSKTKTNA